MYSWCARTKNKISTPDSVKAFLNEYKHNLSLSHEDGHRSFIIEKFEERNIDSVMTAMVDV